MAQLVCSEKVYHADGTMFGYRSPCERKGVRIRADGKPWCTIHDPAAVKARRDKAIAQWKASRLSVAKSQARAALCVAACEGVKDADLAQPGIVLEIIRAVKGPWASLAGDR